MPSEFKIIFDNKDSIVVKNVTNNTISNGYLTIKNIYYHDILSSPLKLNPFESKTFLLSSKNKSVVFLNNWENETYIINIFKDGKCVHQQSINSVSTARNVVLISDKHFENITECLIEGITKYSSVPIYHYTINYKSRLKYDNLTNIEFNIAETDVDSHDHILLVKPKVLSQAIKDGLKNIAFLDSDLQVKSNITKILNYIPPKPDMIVFQKSAWDYVLHNKDYIPGPKLRKFLGMDSSINFSQFQPHGLTNIVLFTDVHKDLFEEWEDVCAHPEIKEIMKKEYLHDELIFNCLLWRKNIKANLSWFSLNIKNIQDVRFFYNHLNLSNKEFVDLNDYNLGIYSQSLIPRNRDDICAFHCIKDVTVANQINKIIYQEEILKQENKTEFFKQKLISFYTNMSKSKKRILQNFPKSPAVKPLQIIHHYVNGAFVELKDGDLNLDYRIEFIDQKSEKVIYENTMKTNHWCKPNIKYFVDWKIRISIGNILIYETKLNLNNKRVLISFDSNSLGDNIAWMPYVEEFRKTHNCNVIVSTFFNELFKSKYSDLEFMPPGGTANDLCAAYMLGCFNLDNRNENPIPWNEVP